MIFFFVASRPAEKVRNEVSVRIGYALTAVPVNIGPAKFAMYTQSDGAWIKNLAEESTRLASCAQRFDQGKTHRRATSDAPGLPDDHSVGTAHRYAQALVHKIPLGLLRRDFKVNLTPVALDEAFLNAKPQLVSSSKCS